MLNNGKCDAKVVAGPGASIDKNAIVVTRVSADVNAVATDRVHEDDIETFQYN